MGRILFFTGPDAGRAETKYKGTGTVGGEDLRTIGERIVTSVNDEIRHELAALDQREQATGRPVAERYCDTEARNRIGVWDARDLTVIPDAVWGALCAAALTVIRALIESDIHDRAYDIMVCDDPGAEGPYQDSERVLAVFCTRTEDMTDDTTAPARTDTLTVHELEPDALHQIDDLRSLDPELLQGWWVEALRHTAEDCTSEEAVDIAVRSAITNSHFPFPDEQGRIRKPHGVGFAILDIDNPVESVPAIRAEWTDDFAVWEVALVTELENLAGTVLSEAMAHLGRDALITGFTVDHDTIGADIITEPGDNGEVTGFGIMIAPVDFTVPGRIVRAVNGSVSSANAAWVRALEGEIDSIADVSGVPRNDIAHVVERSAELLALRELADRRAS